MATRIREKKLAKKANRDNRPTAQATFVRITPKKVQMVLDLVRGKSYLDALSILTNINNAPAEVVKKLIVSAGSNEENNQKNNLGVAKEDLYIAECYANSGPILKRQQIRAKGRVDIVDKRTSHVTVILDKKKEVVK